MKVLSLLIGIVLIVATVAAGAYVGIWLCLVGGIVQVIEAGKLTPVDSMGIAIGAVRVILTGFCTAITFFVGALISGCFIAASE